MQSTTAVIYTNQRLKRGEWVIFLSIGPLGGWQRGDRDPVSRTNFNKIHASRFESVIVGETSGKRDFHDQTQIIHESRIPHEINHASHAFRYSRITFLFK